jgi:hypothetical protein
MTQTSSTVAEYFRYKMSVEQRLLDWRENLEERDQLVRLAHDAGINKNQIHVMTGIARTTINRILGDVSRETSEGEAG